MRKWRFDFMKNKWMFFALSGVLLAISIGSLLLNGLNFGIDFQGGSVITLTNTSVPIEDVRAAFENAGVDSPGVQSVEDGGYIVRFAESSPEAANAVFQSVTEELDLSAESGDVTTIGPGWGKLVTNRALLAMALSIAAILLYVSLRFDYKMSVTAVMTLLHDAVIVMGIYSLTGFEVTPNTVAALLTIMGFSLYDTIVVFHRIKENSAHVAKQTFQQMANDSINQVIVRSINTTIVSLIPVTTLLLFGGPTLRDFAFALFIGMMSSTYSSVGVAAPVYAMWKETEPRFQALKKKYATAS